MKTIMMTGIQESETHPKTLYVGSLPHEITEDLIIALFSKIGPCSGCKIIREPGNDPFCFIEFSDHSTAAHALMAMNKRIILGKEIKVNWTRSPGSDQPKQDTSNHHHIFVGDLSADIETHQLREAFIPFGSISDCKIIRDAQTLQSKGFGFVSFVKKEDAESAIDGMNGQWLGNRPIRTNWASRKPAPIIKVNHKQLNWDDVYNQSSPANMTVYCGGVTMGIGGDTSPEAIENMLKDAFKKYGNVEEIRVFKDKGCAFIRYDSKDSATQAIISMTGHELAGQTIRCSWGKESPTLTAPPPVQQNTNGSVPQAPPGGQPYNYGYGYYPGYQQPYMQPYPQPHQGQGYPGYWPQMYNGQSGYQQQQPAAQQPPAPPENQNSPSQQQMKSPTSHQQQNARPHPYSRDDSNKQPNAGSWH